MMDYVAQTAFHPSKFQHLYLLRRSATGMLVYINKNIKTFQHLYLLRRSATAGVNRDVSRIFTVSTPLPSEKVCDSAPGTQVLEDGDVSTPLPSEKVCDMRVFSSIARTTSIKFQHLYLLRRSATCEKVIVNFLDEGCFNTFTF